MNTIKRSALSARTMAAGICLVLAVTSCGLFAGDNGVVPAPAADRAETLVEQGYAMLNQGDQEGAFDAFSSALQLHADHVPALMGQAIVHSDKMAYEEAFNSYDAIVRNHPENALAWNGRGLAAFNLENFDEAVASFEKAIKDRPVNGFFYESLAWTYMCLKDYSKAADSAKTATLMYDREGEISLYPLLIAYYSYVASGNATLAASTLSYARSGARDRAWPYPVVEYLSGSINRNELLSYVKDRAQETEAHVYIGLTLRQSGEAEAAKRHLDWVCDSGDPRVFEYTLARSIQGVTGQIARMAR